jgi:hypothetical protein
MSKATTVNSAAAIPLPSEFRQRRYLITSFATSCSAVLVPSELHSTTLENAPHLERKQLQFIRPSSIHMSPQMSGTDPKVSRDRPQGLSRENFAPYFKSETFTLLRTLEYREKMDARRGVRAKGATRRRDATVETTSEDGVGGWGKVRAWAGRPCSQNGAAEAGIHMCGKRR